MANEAPVLLLGYNRPQQMRGLIQSLEPLKPKLILLAVDGPKAGRTNDAGLVRQTQNLVSEITWDTEIRTRFRDANLGLRRAVVDAVTWANSEYGRAIVLEDDVRAGPQLLDFLEYNLKLYEKNSQIAHINGYNLVPKDHLIHPEYGCRLSKYPESYAWATWDRAWKYYDDELTWGKTANLKDIKEVCGSTVGAIRWKLNFLDAAAERIDTWAYRWLATLWKNDFLTVSPNRNISEYKGWKDGTHTYLKVKYEEPSIHLLENYKITEENPVDQLAEKWLSQNVFFESQKGVAKGCLTTALLKVWKIYVRLR